MPRTQAKSSSTTQSAGGRRQARAPYNLTCANCRNRKVKCDSAQPECRICLAYGERCHYDKPPPMSQVLSMANRIQELEKALKEQQLTNNEGTATPVSEKDLGAENSKHTSSVITPQSPPTAVARTNISSPASHGEAGGQSIRHHGNSPHYESTSAVKEPELARSTDPLTVHTPAPIESSVSITDDKQLEFWENAAITSCAAILQLPPETASHLLRTHWIWIYPNFMFVSKVPFLRHAATGGPFFSELLLSVICLHATRFTERALSDNLHARVRFLLGRELHSDPSIPTVQALLHLSAYEIGKGDMSQSWLHSGMAFRMAIDMGLFGSCSNRNAQVNPVKQGVRGQLAWSCYIWDKIISLYLGRMPALSDAPACSPVVAGGMADYDTWYPYDPQATSETTKPPTLSYTAFCFANLSKLAVIIHEILMNIYAKRPPDVNAAFALQQKLDGWRSRSAQSLKVDTNADANQCPPSHVLTQSLLYHTTVVLLNRPFNTNEQCRSLCREAAESVERLLLLYDRSYGLGRGIYAIAYCAYTAATVAVLDLQDGIPGQQQRVDTYLRALYSVRTSCPSIQQSIDIILGTLDKLMVSQDPPTNLVGEPGQHPADESVPLPVFMFDQNCYSLDGRFQETDLSFGDLESFPTSFWEPINGAFDNFM